MRRAKKSKPATHKPPLSPEAEASTKAHRKQRKDERKLRTQNGRDRAAWVGMKKLVLGSLILGLLLLPIHEARAEPVAITIGDLVKAPERYSGQQVTFDGVLVTATSLYTVEKSTPGLGSGRRFQLAMADLTGAQVLIIAYVPSYDLPSSSVIGKNGTAYTVRGTFYRIPVEPGPPLLLVVVPSRGGLTKKRAGFKGAGRWAGR